MRVFKFEEIDSTNRYLKDLENKENYDCVIADTQSAGVGRRGNHWVSNRGMALFSFAFNGDSLDEKEYTRLPLTVGIAVLKGLRKIEPLEYKFKWTNDIYLDDKKLCGILVEKVDNWFVIGIGININNRDFGYANDKATSISLKSGKNYIIKDVIYCIINELKKIIEDYNWETINREINRYNYLYGKEIEIVKDNISIGRGVAGKIENDGRLEVNCGEEIRYFDIGEIHIKK